MTTTPFWQDKSSNEWKQSQFSLKQLYWNSNRGFRKLPEMIQYKGTQVTEYLFYPVKSFLTTVRLSGLLGYWRSWWYGWCWIVSDWTNFTHFSLFRKHPHNITVPRKPSFSKLMKTFSVVIMTAVEWYYADVGMGNMCEVRFKARSQQFSLWMLKVFLASESLLAPNMSQLKRSLKLFQSGFGDILETENLLL